MRVRQENLPQIDSYLAGLGSARTTRHASEELFACPGLNDAVDAERHLRATLHNVFDSHVVVEDPEIEEQNAQSDLPSIKSEYWSRAQKVTSAHGAKEGFSLDDYFHVGQDRHYEAIRLSVLDSYPADSVPSLMFGCIDAYSARLDIDSASSSRILFNYFNACLPAIKGTVARLREEGYDKVTASNAAITDFAASMVPDHITELEKRAGEGLVIKSSINKQSLYPDLADGSAFDDVPLCLRRADVEGFTKAYRVQERPYTQAELVVGEQLAQDPVMQRAVLLFHNSLVEFSEEYLAAHPERAMYSLEPFSEIFVPHEEGDGKAYLAPNPKLIKVIVNNVVPAMARILMQEGARPGDLTGDHVQQGIELAKKMRVFNAQIGKFDNYDSSEDTVELSTMFPRVCPASQMFSEAMTRRLPDFYDSSRRALC